MGRVVVAGSINMDIVVSAPRHPRAGETLMGSDLNYFPGGKGANQAVAASRAGVETAMIGNVGGDGFAAELTGFLSGEGIDIAAVNSVPDSPTGTALITVADAENTIVVVPGANWRVSAPDVTAVDLSSDDVLVSQFEIPNSAIESFFAAGKSSGATTILNPAPAGAVSAELMKLVDVLIVNETELDEISGENELADNIEGVASFAANLLDPSQKLIVTLGANGCVLFDGSEPFRVQGLRVNAVDTTGAGDCFVGSLAARLVAGDDFRAALDYANRAASLCVQKPGAGSSMPRAVDVEAIS